ncbi:helix-turn-helix domain-containing protein [Metabacillus sp. GX 13764]|uniref:helix-turn-helix domain-containing protein n=1 Tax=Metabacillus kandeliae TaxID=2900151 RepID=UPI001E3ABC7D|nr:helix-turn-helix domain-containing protein [Metabacillus kandeliae]MCD7034009.1 helix-turn-helix domain-containing protein [Metabacillus kandeliae]
MDAKANLILHPVRMRIVQTLVNGRELTVQEIASMLPEVPQATLYRHLKKLAEGNVIQVAAENQVRGAIEKVYKIAKEGISLSPEEFQNSTKEEQLRVFTQFAGGLIDQFGSYVENGEIDLLKDGVSFRQVDLYLSDGEFREFVHNLKKAFEQAGGYGPRKDRKKRTIATIIIPEGEKGRKQDE